MIGKQLKMYVEHVYSGAGYKQLRLTAVNKSPLKPVVDKDGKPVMETEKRHGVFHQKMEPENPENDRWAAAAINAVLIVTVPLASTELAEFEPSSEYIVTISPAPKA